MKKIDITVNNKLFTFICNWHNTRSGFAHDVTLFINNSEVTTAHCYYINRTWERWSYQSVCIEAINNIYNECHDRLLNAFRNEHNYKRITEKRRQAFNTDYICGNSYLHDLMVVLYKLNKYLY